MEFKDTAEEATFRQHVRDFIRQNLPKDLAGPFDGEDAGDAGRHASIKAWRTQLGGQGWIAPHWPKEYSGAGMSPGEQKSEHLPKITSGEVQWAQGYSEPGAGSDLASLQTQAIRDGDDYVINGQKIWSSGAHRAEWMFMLTRTDPDAPKHRGISMLLVDMKSPGITIQPLIDISGRHVFIQECVRR